MDSKEVSAIKIQGWVVEETLNDSSTFLTYTADYLDLIAKLNNNGVHIVVSLPDTKMNSLFNIFLSWLPMLLLIDVWIFFMRQMQGGRKAIGFGKSKAKLVSDKGPKVMLKDVAGINEAKEELIEIIDFLGDPSKFQKLGDKFPQGCLLIGPPTLLCKSDCRQS